MLNRGCSVALPAEAASSEGAVDLLRPLAEANDLAVHFAEQVRARDAELAAARGNLLLLEETCRYSLGLAGDLIGDALTKAVGDKVIAMRDKAATLRTALEKIADIDPVNMGMLFAVTTAREALAAIRESSSPRTPAVEEPPESRK